MEKDEGKFKVKDVDRNVLKKEDWLAATLQSIGDGVIATDSNGKIIFMNQVAEYLTGWKQKDAINKNLEDIFCLKNFISGADFTPPIDKVLSTGEIQGLIKNTGLKSRDGTERYVSASIAPISDINKKITGTITVFRDITTIRTVEKNLEESERRYRTLFEESKDVIFSSSKDGRFIDINPAGVKLFGYKTKEELLNIDITKDLYVDSFERQKLIETIEENGFVKDYELRLNKKDGAALIVLVTSSLVVGLDGNFIGFRGIIRDVTKLKKLEQQLLQAAKMESIGRFAGGISHDFNNLLTIINGYAETLLITHKNESFSEDLIQILEAGKKASKLVEKILVFSRKQEINPVVLNLNEIIHELEKMLNRILGEDIRLNLKLSEDIYNTLIDPSQAEQILMNLIVNAREAMPNGGSLNIETHKFRIDDSFVKRHTEAKVGEYIELVVSDTGIGMDKSILSEIFEPFYTTKKEGEGTGLGLAIVYGIVKQNKGYITVNSELNKGTTFRIYFLKYSKKMEVAKERSQVEDIKYIGKTVLIAEDEFGVKRLAERIFKSAGFEVLSAVNGEEAIEVARSHKGKIDLLFTDVVMSGITGFDAAEEIEKIYPGIKILFSSGYPSAIQKFNTSGKLTQFIKKPFSKQRILEKLQSIF